MIVSNITWNIGGKKFIPIDAATACWRFCWLLDEISDR